MLLQPWAVVVVLNVVRAAPSLSHAPPPPIRLIVDTDAGFDVDDVGAIGVANALMDAGEATIIAVGHTNGFPIGIGGVSTLMRFYGRDDVPLGAYKGVWARDPTAGKGTADKYLSDLVDHYPGAVQNASQVLSAVEVYRKALAASPDRSVHIASIGITTNMRDLVQSLPDAHSPLSGIDLIAQKVNLVVWMDMMWVARSRRRARALVLSCSPRAPPLPSARRYNFGCAQAASDDWLGPDTGCRGSAQAAVMGWPPSVKQIFSSVGRDVTHGAQLSACAGLGNPYKQAFEDWGVATTGRSAWDPIAVLIAVRGAAGVHCEGEFLFTVTF